MSQIKAMCERYCAKKMSLFRWGVFVGDSAIPIKTFFNKRNALEFECELLMAYSDGFSVGYNSALRSKKS